MRVKDLSERSDLILIMNSQDVENMKTHLKSEGINDVDEYNSFFIKSEAGELVEVYGIYANIPYLDAIADEIITTEVNKDNE